MSCIDCCDCCELNSANEMQFVCTSHSDTVLTGLNELRKNSQLCDVTLEAEGVTFPAHRAILSSFSSYFKAMFTSSLAESQQHHITLTGVDATSLSLILDFAYTATIDITETNVQRLLSASNLLEITSVRRACCNYLIRNISSSNAFGIHCFAEFHSCDVLSTKAKEFALQNFEKIVSGEEWLNLTQDKVIEFVANDNLKVVHEEDVYRAVSSWLHHSYTTRHPTFHKVLEHIRLPLISPYFLVDVIEKENAVRTSPECRILVDEAKQYHLLPDRREYIASLRMKPRVHEKIRKVLILVGGEDSNLVLRSMESYDPTNAAWRSLTYLPFAISKHAMVSTGDNSLYLAGGEYSDSQLSCNLLKYDALLNSWIQLSPMKYFRSSHGFTSLDGHLYAVAGWDGHVMLNSVEKYDPDSNTWSDVAAFPTEITSAAVVSLRGRIFACGGSTSTEDVVDSVYIYDPLKDTWETGPSLVSPRSGSSAVVVNGCIYVIGGLHNATEITNKIEKFNPKSGSWQLAGNLMKKRYKAGVAVIDNKIYILGGEFRWVNRWDTFHNTIECYDPTTEKSELIGELFTGRAGLCCASLWLREIENTMVESSRLILSDNDSEDWSIG